MYTLFCSVKRGLTVAFSSLNAHLVTSALFLPKPFLKDNVSYRPVHFHPDPRPPVASFCSRRTLPYPQAGKSSVAAIACRMSDFYATSSQQMRSSSSSLELAAFALAGRESRERGVPGHPKGGLVPRQEQAEDCTVTR